MFDITRWPVLAEWIIVQPHINGGWQDWAAGRPDGSLLGGRNVGQAGGVKKR